MIAVPIIGYIGHGVNKSSCSHLAGPIFGAQVGIFYSESIDGPYNPIPKCAALKSGSCAEGTGDEGHFMTLYQVPAGAEEHSTEEDSAGLVTVPRSVNKALQKKLMNTETTNSYAFPLESIPENGPTATPQELPCLLYTSPSPRD